MILQLSQGPPPHPAQGRRWEAHVEVLWSPCQAALQAKTFWESLPRRIPSHVKQSCQSCKTGMLPQSKHGGRIQGSAHVAGDGEGRHLQLWRPALGDHHAGTPPAAWQPPGAQVRSTPRCCLTQMHTCYRVSDGWRKPFNGILPSVMTTCPPLSCLATISQSSKRPVPCAILSLERTTDCWSL